MHIIRIFFTKTGESAYISHLDLQRVMARALRKSKMPVWWSQGFNPHIYMSFVLPLSLGHESLCEMVDCKTEHEESFDVFLKPLNDALPRGINATAIMPPVNPSGELGFAKYTLFYPDAAGDITLATGGYNKAETAFVTQKTKRSESQLDLKTIIPELTVNNKGEIEICLPAGNSGNVNPSLLTGMLQNEYALDSALCKIVRQEVYTKSMSVFR